MTEPLLVAASELKDAIDSVVFWRDALIRHLEEERDYIDDKKRLYFLLNVLKKGGGAYGEYPTDVTFEDIKETIDRIVKLAKEEGYK